MEKHKHDKTETPLEETGVGQVESGFIAESPLDVLAAAAAGPGVPPSQLRKQMAEVGIKVPEKPAKEKKEVPLEATGVGQVESGFTAKSSLDVLTVASGMSGLSRKELKEQMAEVGIGMPDKPKKEKKPHETHQSGVDSIEEGFLAEPEMTPVEELDTIRYAASPAEIHEEIEKVEGKERLPLNEALLAKLRESGYTGDLETLRKLAEELKE